MSKKLPPVVMRLDASERGGHVLVTLETTRDPHMKLDVLFDVREWRECVVLLEERLRAAGG